MRRDMPTISRRTALLTGAVMLLGTGAAAATSPKITVWKDPNCGCCGGWVTHLQRSGFKTTVIETTNVQAIKVQKGVPADLSSCHTAEVGGYTIEGHVPAEAILRLIAERPTARGLAVPGMPTGSPGMEGGSPEEYAVMLFGDGEPSTFSRFIGLKSL